VTSAGSGVVQSPNFPADYGYESCAVTIVVPAGKRIRLTFTTFNLEFNKAYIFVRLIQFAFIEIPPPLKPPTVLHIYFYFSS
jgi:hypothetical protein